MIPLDELIRFACWELALLPAAITAAASLVLFISGDDGDLCLIFVDGEGTWSKLPTQPILSSSASMYI